MELKQEGKTHLILGIISLILGYLFVRFTIFSIREYYGEYGYGIWLKSGLGICLFTLLFFITASWYARRIGRKASRESIFWGAMLLLQGLGFLLLVRPSMSFLLLFGLFFTAVYWVMVRFGVLEAEKTSDWMVRDCIRGFFFGPFSNLHRILFSFKYITSNRKKGRTCLQVLVGLLIAVPVLLIAYSLLCQIDAGFSDILSLDRITSWISTQTEERIIIFCIGIPVACYIFGLFFYGGSRQHEQPVPDEVQDITGKVELFPMTTVATVMIMVILLYGFFFIVQGTYLFSAFAGELPESYTYAEYARRGFFELCIICVLNLILLFFSHYLCKDSNAKLLKIISITIYVFNLLFLVIAFRKMILYITTYGLTHKRILTCWFMVFLAIVIVIGILRQFRRFSMLRFSAFAGILLFTAFSLSNVDGWIADNNAYLYEQGQMEEPDYHTLLQCGPAALPAIKRLQADDPQIVQELKDIETNIKCDYHDSDHKWYEIIVQNEIIW